MKAEILLNFHECDKRFIGKRSFFAVKIVSKKKNPENADDLVIVTFSHSLNLEQ